jgi:ribosomal protein S18 acetylase RimI-like enzyme
VARIDLRFRPACGDDAEACLSLVYSSGPKLIEYMFATRKHRARGFVEYAFRRGGGFLGHRIHTVAEHGGQIVGVLASYDGTQLRVLNLEMAQLILDFYGPLATLSVMRNAGHSQSVMKAPPRDGLYIANLGVHADWRGKGVGSALIAHAVAQARKNGYRQVSLDVALGNDRAEQLYRRIGFVVTKERAFVGRRGADVPGARNMVLSLAS